MHLNLGKWVERIGIWVLSAFAISMAERESVSVEDVFWAYDDGRIGEEELEELLLLIENGDIRGACAEWEAMGGDPCEKTLSEKLEIWEFSGMASYAMSLDSVGSVRNERASLSFGLFRFSADARLKSTDDGPFRLDHWRLVYRDSKSYSILGNISAADVKSAVPFEKRTGNVWGVGRKKWQLGTLLLTDSTAGIYAIIGAPERLQFVWMELFSLAGWREAFVRVRLENADAQISFFEDTRNPLFFVSAKSNKIFPLKLRFRAYFHENRNGFGVFRVPKMVEKNRAFGNVSALLHFLEWNFRLDGHLAVPLDSGRSRCGMELQVQRVRKMTALGVGSRLVVAGDSLSTLLFLRSGVRLFAAESLFCEWRGTPRGRTSESLFEIRPGIRFWVTEGVAAKAVLLVKGLGKKKLVLREETEMHIAMNLYGKSRLEVRASRLRDLHLYRLGLELMGKI